MDREVERQKEVELLIQEASDKVEAEFKKYKNLDCKETSDVADVYKNKLLNLLKREFPGCVVTISRFYFTKWSDDVSLRSKIKITFSKVARIECEIHGEIKLSHTKWSYEVFDFNPPTQRYNRSYNHPITSEKIFNFKGISDYFKANSGKKITETANVVPGIIDYLKQTMNLKITSKKIGVGEDGKFFNYIVTIKGEDHLGVDIKIIQKESEISVTDCYVDKTDYIYDLSDPKCFDKVRESFITISKHRVASYIQALEVEVATSQKQLLNERTLLKQINDCVRKEKNSGDQAGN